MMDAEMTAHQAHESSRMGDWGCGLGCVFLEPRTERNDTQEAERRTEEPGATTLKRSEDNKDTKGHEGNLDLTTRGTEGTKGFVVSECGDVGGRVLVLDTVGGV